MKESVQIQAPNVVARFFDKVLAKKREKNLEIKRKIKSGEIKVTK